MTRFRYIALICLLAAFAALADGLMIADADGYPKELMRNRMTRVNVNIHGLLAETTVYQEFNNEWDRPIDAVYSFPLPPGARATEFLYWYEDKVYKAVLKVRQQATNPGTGQGGVVAEVNDYIGRNGIRVALKNVPAGKIQAVQMTYIEHCDFFAGTTSYRYPLATSDFITHPLNLVQFTVHVENDAPITGFELPNHGDYRVLAQQDTTLTVRMARSKMYVSSDFIFEYSTQRDELGVDFYSCANDSVDGHFILYVRPQNQIDPDESLKNRFLFLVNRNSSMGGYKLDACKTAIRECISTLSETDEFNILAYDNGLNGMADAPLAATAANKQQAGTFLDGIGTGWGNDLQSALETALAQITDSDANNAIVVFTDGYAYIDPRQTAAQNDHQAGIFPVGIGDDLAYERLEMLAASNYGFVTYLQNDGNLYDGMHKLLDQVRMPIMKNTRMEFGRGDLHDILPSTMPTAYAGSYFFLTGRYGNSGASSLAMAGETVAGMTSLGFQLDFTDSTRVHKFAESIWAKEMIDKLEQEVEIYGESEPLKQQIIDLSLGYNIRSRYTAYVADYETPATDVDSRQLPALPTSYLVGNYPNPFNPSTTLEFMLDAESRALTKLIRIYNALGQLVAVFDISHLQPGSHRFQFDGHDFYGNALPSGQYFAQLVVGDQVSTIRMMLTK